MYLAGNDCAYRYLVFDFDAHSFTLADACADVERFTTLLTDDLGLPFVECESSPGRGFHVWLALAEPVPAPIAGLIADIAKRMFPTLDKGPLNAAGTGAARTPGAPHRLGGVSRVLRGDVATLLTPSVTAVDVDRLASALDAIAPPPPPQLFDRAERDALVLVDHDGHAYLPGPKRPLGAVAAGHLSGTMRPDSDASAVMYSVLLGAARARWHFADVLEHLPSAPGLEHARSERVGPKRAPRTPRAATSTLARQWESAVRRVSSTRLGLDASQAGEVPAQVVLITGVIKLAQAHANASPGAWTHSVGVAAGAGRHRATDRAVLDELHRRALIALTTDVGVSVRTLAIALTVGRESVRQSLHRLAHNGWIRLITATEGPAAATWSIDPAGVFHREAVETWSAMGGPAPHRIYATEASRQRTELLNRMAASRSSATHDVFIPQALGPQAGRLYAALVHAGPTETTELATAAHMDSEVVASVAVQLCNASLASRVGGRWVAAGLDRRDAVASLLGVEGVLDGRRVSYQLEQATWAYWQEELAVTSRALALVTSRVRQVKVAGEQVLALGPYPRRPDNGGSWRLARDRIVSLSAA